VQTADSAIQIAQQNLSSAQNTFEFTQKMVRKGFATPLQLEADQFAVDRAQLDLDAANTSKRVLQDFTYEKTTKQLEATSEAAAAQLKAEIATLQNEEDHLKHLEGQLKSARSWRRPQAWSCMRTTIAAAGGVPNRTSTRARSSATGKRFCACPT
jgi:hypothetical protein